MTEQLEYEVLIKTTTGSGINNVIVVAADFGGAVTEAVKQFGLSNILAIVQAPYSLADELMCEAEMLTPADKQAIAVAQVYGRAIAIE